jgi:hypothetical protein
VQLEELVEGRVVHDDVIDRARGRTDEDEAGVGRQRLAQGPVRVAEAIEDEIEVVDEKDERPLRALGLRLEERDRMASTLLGIERFELGASGLERLGARRIAWLDRLDECGQRIHPEVGGGSDVVLLLGEAQRDELCREALVDLDLRGEAQEQHRLAGTASTDDEVVVAAAAEVIDELVEQRVPRDEALDQHLAPEQMRVVDAHAAAFAQ